MNCSVCQSINGDDANFCRACGAAFAHAPGPTAPNPPAPRPEPDPLWAPTVPTTSPEPQWAASLPAPTLDEPGPQAFQDDDNDVEPTLAVPVGPVVAAVDVRRTVAAELAARRRRDRTLLFVGAIVAVVVLVVVAVFAFGRDSESTESTASSDPLTDSLLPVVTTVAPIGPTTVVAVTVAPTATATTPAAPTTVAVVVAPPSTVAPTVTSVPTAPTAVTTPATVAPTIAPTTTPASPVTTVAPATTAIAQPAGTGDLGLSKPISKPACDGQYITLIGASVDTPGVAGRVDGLLDRYPGSKYLKTELVCSSLSPRSADGDALYVVFFGPFASTSDACSARSNGTKDSYVKVLANTPAPSGAEKC